MMLMQTKITAASSAATIAMRPVDHVLRGPELLASDILLESDMGNPQAAFFTSMMRTLSHRQNTIRDTKKMTDGNSSTPSVMCWNCAKNDIERTASITKAGAQERTDEMTRSNPAITNRKLTAVAPMKASTWLLVSAEIAAASARK